jgi:hypothetical protein
VTWQDGDVAHPHRPDPRRIRPPGPDLPRRRVLRGLVGIAGVGLVATGALSGCDPFTGGGGTPKQNPLTGFVAATLALGARYDATIAALPALGALLTPARDAHRTHAAALARAVGVDLPTASPSPVAVPPDRGRALAALATAEKAARDQAVAACLAAAPGLAPLLGSIAAARASHLEILK